MKTKVYTVDSVALTVSGAASIRVTAEGTVRTGGWTEPALKPSERQEVAGESGTMHLDFVATKPEGIVPEVVLPIAAHADLPAPGPGQTLKVIVHAETDEKSGAIGSPIDPP